MPDNQYLIATVARTLHTCTNTVKILCEAFKVEFESNAFMPYAAKSETSSNS